jgi:purine nucleosidase
VTANADVHPRRAMKLVGPLLGPMVRRTLSQRPAQLSRGWRRRATRSGTRRRNPAVPACDDAPVRVHVDTDFGGDPDDACALAMLLGWPGIDVVGVTTNLDAGGKRAGCAAYYLQLAGRDDIPVVAGAEATMTSGAVHEPTWGDARHWPEPIEPRPAPRDAALDLLADNIVNGVTIVAIGAFTNLARLELQWPGVLGGEHVVAMTGWLPGQHAPAGLPDRGAGMDWNTQCDPRAAEIVAARADMTLVTLPTAMRAQLRVEHLSRLRATGPVGALLARQSDVHGRDNDFGAVAEGLVNFHWDPVTAAVAVQWAGARVEERDIATEWHDDVLVYVDAPDGRATQVVVDVDGDAFTDDFLTAIERVDRA